MKPKLITFVLALSCFHGAFGQSFELSGHIRNTSNASIPFASVFLLKESDSTLVKGTSANEEGFFVLDNITAGLYFLKASYVGQSSKNRALEIFNDLKIGAVIIEDAENELDEVTVVSAKPVVERQVDRIVFNVENTVVSENNTWDILRQTPGVIVTGDELKVRNKATEVYINYRRVQLSTEEIRTLLENYQGTHVKSVEVIHNPPASFDAEGGAVLNIITSKNVSLGYKGTLNAGITQGIFSKYNIGTSHFYKTKKLNLNASYTYAPRKVFKDVQNTINFRNETGVFSVWDTDFDQTYRNETHNIGLVADYDFDDKNTLSVTSNMLLSPYKASDFLQSTSIENGLGQLDSTFVTNSKLQEVKNNIAADITYKHTFTNEGTLTMNGHYTYFDVNRSQEVRSNYFLPDNTFLRDYNFLTHADQKISIKTTQVDYVTTLEDVVLETGAKGSFIDSESILDFFLLENEPTLVPNLSDNFQYEEEVFAGYLSLSKDWEKWSLKGGLRAEQTLSTGTSINVEAINTLRYFELFPSLYLLHNINENNSLAFDYSRKLERPRYQDLNPFRTYINENAFVEGNPNLLPSFSHNFNLNYTLQQEFFFDFYYRDNGQYISSISFQDNDLLVSRDISQNVLESTSYGIDFTYGTSIKNKWYIYSYFSLFHEDETFLALESDEISFKNQVNGFYADITNYLTLSKDASLKGELGFVHMSTNLQGSYVAEASTNLFVGIRKTFLNNRAVVSMSANDLLGRYNTLNTSRYLNQDNRYLATPETQYVRFGFLYKFGNFRLEDNSRDIDKKERERLE